MVGLHDVEMLLRNNNHILEHSKRVVEEIESIAKQFELDVQVCKVSALCHDVGGLYTGEEMLERAGDLHMPLDPAELQFPFLLHQRFSEMICRERFQIADERVMEAVGCHTTLKANASCYDMALYIADKLAWDQSITPPYEKDVRLALTLSLETACLTHIDYMLCNGMIVMPHSWLLEARRWLIPFAASS